MIRHDGLVHRQRMRPSYMSGRIPSGWLDQAGSTRLWLSVNHALSKRAMHILRLKIKTNGMYIIYEYIIIYVHTSNLTSIERNTYFNLN